VTPVIMAAPLDLAGSHRQRRLARSRAWISDFSSTHSTRARSGRCGAQRVGGQLEGLDAVRLQAEGAPDASDARSRDTAVPRTERYEGFTCRPLAAGLPRGQVLSGKCRWISDHQFLKV
jgi:hypothetical protein